MNSKPYGIRMAAGLCAAALVLGGCGNGTIDNSATLVNVNKGEDTISLGYGNFVAHFTQAEYDSYYVDMYGAGNYWASPTDESAENSETVEDSVKSDVMEDIQTGYLSRVHAPDYKVELSDEQTKDIEKAVGKFFEDNSDEAVAAMGATEEYVTQYLTDQTYVVLVSDAVKEEGAGTIKDEDVVQTSYSYVHLYRDESTDNPEETRTDEELEAAAKAISEASDFEAAAKEQNAELSDDVFTKAMSAKDAAEEFRMPVEVIKAVKKLKKEGDVSGVIKVEDDGFYVVRLDELEDEEETEVEREDKIDIYYEDTLNGWISDTDWSVDEKQWDKVRFNVLLAEPSSDEESTDDTDSETTESTDEAAEPDSTETTDTDTEAADTETETTDADNTEAAETSDDASDVTEESTEE